MKIKNKTTHNKAAKKTAKNGNGNGTRLVALAKPIAIDKVGRSAQRQVVVKALTSLGATSAKKGVAIDRVVAKAAPGLKLHKGVKPEACVAFHIRALKNEKLVVEQQRTA